ncbi:glycosyltransferase family 2 protein [Sutcliffiella horikoshii]|uniref:Glycosyltransferase family 2 protein n=1 Tax=Sutcliffiella horikoshii TaxID=79883 RepID=A0A5D4T5G1_9BACI|nr:glycosyltransferase family 2 protein [Sutcliffiella horikoshii]TYS69702.1 glycosyltransferase family 2 protein [Sutcliffiella horikoshii]
MKNIFNPKISVIIPVYNTEQYLNYCVDSVLNQEYQNIEVILVNDGSTDKSADICDKYQKVDERVKVIHQSNSGASTARNKGIDNATGEYIMFLDSDDFWVDGCLGKIISKLEKSEKEVDVMFLKYAVIKENGSLTDFKGYKFDYFNRVELLRYISTQDKVAVSACLKVINKKIFSDKRVYFKDSLLAEDIDWFFKLVSVANSFVTYDGGFYCYRILKSSASRSTNEKRIADYLYILNKWIKLTSEKIDEAERDYFYYMIGYEYEILLATFFDYDKRIRDRYLIELKDLFWLLDYRNKPRSNLIKILNKTIGFRYTCRLLNLYLHKRKIK